MESCIGRADPEQGQFGLQDGAAIVASLTALYAVICGTLTYFLSVTACLFCLLCIVAAAMAASEALEKRHPAAPTLYLLGGGLALLGFSMGTTNYHSYYAPYVDAVKGQEYRYLRASSSAVAHSDGGVLTFARDTLVDSTRSLGLLSHGTVFCVAPVLDVGTEQALEISTPSNLPQDIQYWAIGLDCCSARGYFTCDDSTVVGARSAFVYHRAEESMESNLFAPKSNYDEFVRAVDAAKAMYNLAGTAEPVLVRWVETPKRVLNEEFHSTLYLWLGSSTVVMLFTILIWIPTSNYWHQKLVRAYDGKKDARVKKQTAAFVAANKAAKEAQSTSADGRPKQDPFLMGKAGGANGQTSPRNSPRGGTTPRSGGGAAKPNPANTEEFSMSALLGGT